MKVWSRIGSPSWIATLMLLAACGPKASNTPEQEAALALAAPKYEIGETVLAVDGGDAVTFEGASGLSFALSNASTPVQARPKPQASPLDATRSQALLGMLPAMPAAPTSDFALRSDSLKPPLTGTDKKVSFPPAGNLAAPTGLAAAKRKENLTVVRTVPEGEVHIAQNVRVVFSQPMVPLSDLGTVAKKAPVTLKPRVDGAWEWLDTRTAKFKPTVRMPMATEYTVTVPKGVTSSLGAKTAEPITSTFLTPPPRVLATWPGSYEPTGTDTPIFVRFDQSIDRAAVLRTITLKSDKETFPLELIPEAEVLKDSRIEPLTRSQRADFWLAFRSKKELPKDTRFEVTVGPKTPSAEGPRVTKDPYRFDFRTYGPFKVTEARCAPESGCHPGHPFYLRFSNRPDEAAYKPEYTTITPTPEEYRTDIDYDYMAVLGKTQLGATYMVKLDRKMTDTFGQTLTGDDTFTFTVVEEPPYPPQLHAYGSRMTVLEPSAERVFTVFSMNHPELKVRLYSVEPKDLSAFEAYYEAELGWDRSAWSNPQPPGTLVQETTLKPGGEKNAIVESRIDLTPALNTDGFGQLMVVVEPPTQHSDPYYKQMVISWVQSTNIGVTALYDNQDILGWASQLADGAPLSGVTLEILDASGTPRSAKADKSGLASFAADNIDGSVLIARKGSDMAILPDKLWAYGEDYKELAWFIFDDRQLYRPGETVSVKGWFRVIDRNKGGDVALLKDGPKELSYTIYDGNYAEIGNGSTTTNGLDAFDLSFDIPDDANLGWAYLEINLDGVDLYGTNTSHGFRIEEFRRPEFEVSASVSSGPHIVAGDPAFATVTAGYFSGGPLSEAEALWTVYAERGSYRPPNHDRFSFGEQLPYWYWYGHMGDYLYTEESLQAVTDRDGEHRMRLDFKSVNPAAPMTVSANARVMDVNRQAWSASTSFIVHPSNRYVGLRALRNFVVAGSDIEIDALVTDIDGGIQGGARVEIRGVRKDWDDDWNMVDRDPTICRFNTTAKATRCTFPTRAGGTHEYTATVWDAEGRPNQTRIVVWVAGDAPMSRDVNLEAVTLLTDKPEYVPGETAEILVQAPWYPAEGILTVNRSGVIHHERFSLTGPTHTVRIPVGEQHVPNAHISVELVGQAPRMNADYEPDDTLPKRPSFAAGGIELKVPPVTRELRVALEPAQKIVEPGANTSVSVTVRNAFGEPVPDAEVALVVVDEAILSLAGYRMGNPLEYFYPYRNEGMSWSDMRSAMMLEDPNLVKQLEAEKEAMFGDDATGGLGMSGAGRGGGGMSRKRMAKSADKMVMAESSAAPEEDMALAPPAPPGQGGQSTPAVKVRTNFSPLAVFSPSVRTKVDGTAEVSFTMPDNLTRYRVMAVAVAGDTLYGVGESNITARLTLMVRPSPPRFLNFGDTFELPIVVQNLSDDAIDVEIAARASNVELTSGDGRTVSVPPRDRVEVRLPARAQLPGKAHFQVIVSGAGAQDAAFFDLPVWTPATTEAFAVYGEVDASGGAVLQPIERPKDVVETYGGVEVTTSSTQLHALTDAVIYLVTYPYECSEQISSRLLAMASLKDVLGAFEAEGLPSPEAMLGRVSEDMRKLATRQNYSGGFGYWNQEDDAYLTVHVTHALLRAQAKGFDIDPQMLTSAISYITNIDQHFSHWYSPMTKEVVRAYALYVRSLAGADKLGAEAQALIDRVGLKKLPLEAVGWLLYVRAKDPATAAATEPLIKHLQARSTETAATAHFSTSWSDEEAFVLLHSSRKADAVILEALIAAQPTSDLITKVVRGLLAHRIKGRWYNTQENAFVLVGLDAYFQAFESVAPDFVARVWLGEQYAGDATFKGFNTDRYHIDIPMNAVVTGEPTKNLILQKDGADGRLYYRIGMRYAPSNLTLDPLDRGFIVERAYEPVDDPADVTQRPDGTWVVKSGARVRVRLKMVAQGRRYHVALVDKLPAGLEPLNPALATTEDIPSDPKVQGGYDWWARFWFEHQNLRDERVEAFTRLLWAGEYTYTYVARATTPGTFVVPPAKAEEMYFPETFGRSASEKLVVE